MPVTISELKVANSNFLFCHTNSPKPKLYSIYNDIKNTEKQKLLTLEKLEKANVWLFCYKSVLDD